jgi:hypothetical protein
MFARVVSIGLLAAAIGFASPVRAADLNTNNNVDDEAPAAQAAPANPAAPAAAAATPGTPAATTTPGGTTTPQASGPETPTDKIVDQFMKLDTDKSDSVSFDEYMAMVQQRAKDRFDAMDANHDGQVTPDEYRAFWQLRKSQWYRLKR